LDIVIGLALIIAVLIGFAQGFVRQAFLLMAFLAAVLVASEYRDVVGAWIVRSFPDSDAIARQTISAFLLFVAVSTGIKFLTHQAFPITKVRTLGLLDNIFGAGLGVLSGSLIVGAGLIFLDSSMKVSWYALDGSRFALINAAEHSILRPGFLVLLSTVASLFGFF
jgi:membrane protein required for colicin V production